MHKLITTQIRRHLKKQKKIPPEWKEFVNAVGLAYEEADDDSELMERAMSISSEEIMEKNSDLMDEIAKRKRAEYTLKKINLELEQRVAVRTEELHLSNQELETKVIKLNESESRTQAIMDGVIDGIITIDEDGIIESLNPATEEIFGYNSQELIGQKVTLLIPERYREKYDNARKRVKETGKVRIIGQYLEVEGLRKSGTIFPLGIAINRMKIRDRYIYTGVVRDITVQKQKELELVQAKEGAEQANHAKSEFLSNMSHELRTPLNAILGFSQLLLTNRLEPPRPLQKSQTKQILKAGNHLLELINEILDLSGIESSAMSLSIQNIRLAQLVEDVLSLVTPLAKEKSIQIINRIKAHPDIWILADDTRLKQVLLNLVSNAIKYTDDGGKMTLDFSGPKEGRVTISVADNGMGIPKEKINSLFEPFNRLGAEHTEVEGTGIGLCITKRLVDMMNGAIDVESAIGIGSTFSIQIPEGEKREILVPESSCASQSDRAEENTETSVKLLYVEDNPDNLELVKQIFAQRDGVKLLSASNAKLGIDLACCHQPDLILMDINLPEIDGITALKHLKSHEETRDIPVIAVSANASQSGIDRAMGAGFEAYITKPIEIEFFLETINKFLCTSPQSTV